MKVKAVEIAKKLGISKATVSLALNGKSGVNEETRKRIMDCYHELENPEIPSAIGGKLIKVIVCNQGMRIVQDSEMDLWTDVLAVFDREAKKINYTVNVIYANIRNDNLRRIIDECNMKDTAGVVLFATELNPSDYQLFKDIQKPMVIYDSDLEDDSHYYILINNGDGVKKAVDYLKERNFENIVYLATEINIYNFRARREGFLEAVRRYNLPKEQCPIVALGSRIDENYRKMTEYLEHNKLPEAFINENYQVSFGMLKALAEKGIRVPEDVSVIGIDEIPDYLTGSIHLTAIKIPHTQRARLVMSLLEQEIEKEVDIKSRVLANCRLVEGNTVGGKGK